MTIKELREQRTRLILQARGVYDKAKAETREALNTEERAEYHKRLDAIRDIDKQIKAVESRDDHAALAELEAADKRPGERRSAPIGLNRGGRERLETAEYREAFNDYFAKRSDIGTLQQRGLLLGTDASGGYMSVPTALADVMLETIDDMCDIHGMATHLSVPGATTVRIPKVTARGDDADWTTEVQTVSPDTGLAFGKTDLTPIVLTKLVKISRTLLSRVEAAQKVVFRQMGRLFGVTWEKAALVGSGSGAPLGIFIASSSGIPTGRDVSTGNTQTEITSEGLLRAKYSIKQAYLSRPTCKWIAHPNFMVNVLLLVDNNNRPLFVPSNGQQGREDTLLGIPIRYSEFAPNTWTTGQYVACLGDMEQYYIADGSDFAIQVVDQLYAATNEVGFFGRCEQDGKPGQEEAFIRVKLS